MYSSLCLWLLTWSDLGGDFNEDGGRYNDAGANYERFLVSCLWSSRYDVGHQR
jgi:hypothetical protein